MKFKIKHETVGRIRVHLHQKRMSCLQADVFQYYLDSQDCVLTAKIYERTQDAVICYQGDREQVISILKKFHYEDIQVPDDILKNSGRELNGEYWEKLVEKVVLHYGCRWFLPSSFRALIISMKSIKYIRHGLQTLLQGKIEVPVLDGTAVGISVFRGDFATAGSIMFLLGIGETLEEWTHKKSVGDLARSMSLNVSKVWLVQDSQQILVPVSEIQAGDHIVVRMGNVIPFDGIVIAGEASVNQSSLTGESVPVRKCRDRYAYAGTVIEEGELTIQVKENNGSSKFEKIVTMIEESEKLKSSLESKALHLADQLVSYTLAGSALTYLVTRNTTKALSVLMVDFSCALKLAMPIAVLSAIREAGSHNITVKGGKFLEAMAEADTVVFDKTGTLTKACPTVSKVVSFNGDSEDELLRIAACLEEHFPHSMAKAVVDAARSRNLIHEEMHSKVEYIVAHGISTTIEGKRAIIGSYHFVFEDEKSQIPEGMQNAFDELPPECSHLYMAIEGILAAVICIEDPIRPEAGEVIRELKNLGLQKVVMMTGDSERTAKTIAEMVGVDEYYAEVLPEDKAAFIEAAKADGRKVIMMGDGINDSPALSASDVGIAVSDGAELAREIADVTIMADDLYEMITLKRISNALMERIHRNYRFIVGFNAGLISLGVLGILSPAASAMLHNTSTLMISLSSMKDLLDPQQ